MTYRRLTTVPMRKAPNVSSRVGRVEGGSGKSSGIAFENGISATSSGREDKAGARQGKGHISEKHLIITTSKGCAQVRLLRGQQGWTDGGIVETRVPRQVGERQPDTKEGTLHN